MRDPMSRLIGQRMNETSAKIRARKLAEFDADSRRAISAEAFVAADRNLSRNRLAVLRSFGDLYVSEMHDAADLAAMISEVPNGAPTRNPRVTGAVRDRVGTASRDVDMANFLHMVRQGRAYVPVLPEMPDSQVRENPHAGHPSGARPYAYAVDIPRKPKAADGTDEDPVCDEIIASLPEGSYFARDLVTVSGRFVTWIVPGRESTGTFSFSREDERRDWDARNRRGVQIPQSTMTEQGESSPLRFCFLCDGTVRPDTPSFSVDGDVAHRECADYVLA